MESQVDRLHIRLFLELHLVVQQSDLFTGLEGGQPNVRTAIAPESIAQCAIPARADLALDGKVDLVEIVRGQLESLEPFVRRGSCLCVLVL